jgi:hypothetical protein
MKTKANILQKTIAVMVLFVLFVSSTAFKDKAKIIAQDQGYYFFLEFQPGSSSDYSNTRYISSIIYYEGYDGCGNDYDFKPKVQKAFENYIKANYNESYVRHNRTFDKKTNSTDKIKTTQQAKDVINKYVADEKAKGNTVVQTAFTYSCN